MRGQWELEKARSDCRINLNKAVNRLIEKGELNKKALDDIIDNDKSIRLFNWVIKDNAKVDYSEEPKKKGILGKLFKKEPEPSF